MVINIGALKGQDHTLVASDIQGVVRVAHAAGALVKVIIEKNRAIVEGVNMISKHTKPSADHPQGGIVKREASLNISNLMLVENGTTTKVGFRMEGDKKVRFSKKSKEVL